ncbi:fungal-specific transcription factor domain-containing protein [Aspergillus bertholletiae]|uniref:Fungal-specific transcription factor domain-containing protein n=1 Tax=Aspergillus bertholletiae TaxID=1226010 RepID=A0A5N7ARX5_9EURO|nr:fungal-specific transcription factor domain-containing protein [Aspergillus bertholletiae]
MTKGCYTCRRRRIICDNGLPTCRKCRDAGKECLGYQKPLVWVKGGVASRGKMMGRSFDDVAQSFPDPSSDDGSPSAVDPPPSAVDAQDRLDTGSYDVPQTSVFDDAPDAAQWENNFDLIAPETKLPVVDLVPTPRGMVDPLFKDMDPMSRFYISHFHRNVVDCLAFYSNVRNPYRDLTALVGDSPVLAHALATTGALHYALLASRDFSPTPWLSDGASVTGALPSPQDVEKAVISSMSRRPSSKFYEQFLKLKQRTLRQLSLDLQDPLKQNDNRTLAVIMVLALVDAIESGDGAWKYHLEGAKKLLKRRQSKSPSSPTQHMIDWLDAFVLDGCLVMQVMGATLARPGSLSKPFYSSDMGPETLRRLEETAWIGCPAYLLEVIFFVHEGWCVDPDPSTDPPAMNYSSAFLPKGSNPLLQPPTALLQHIQAFNPVAWAEEMQSFLYLPDLTVRTALATIWRAAVYLYTSRVLSRPRAHGRAKSTIPGLPPDHKAITNLLIQQIPLIPVADDHYKCLIWPTFIAGAECTDPSHRPILLQTLSGIYYDVTSVNVRNAGWVLSLMWQKRDARRAQQQQQQQQQHGDDLFSSFVHNEDDDGGDDFDWIQELDDSRIDWLFI